MDHRLTMPEFNGGEFEYYTANLTDTQSEWCYSAQGLQQFLDTELWGQKIQRIFVDLDAYLEAIRENGFDENSVDLSCVGGGFLVVTENNILSLCAHGTGQFTYRLHQRGEMEFEQHFGALPENYEYVQKQFLYDLYNHGIAVDYEEARIKQVKVFGTDHWAIVLKRFDSERADRAGNKNDLPNEVQIITDSCVIRFVADSIEYGYVIFRPL